MPGPNKLMPMPVPEWAQVKLYQCQGHILPQPDAKTHIFYIPTHFMMVNWNCHAKSDSRNIVAATSVCINNYMKKFIATSLYVFLSFVCVTANKNN